MNLKALFICAVAALCAPSAQAALVDMDQYTLDTDINLEWLNLTLTQGVSYDGILAGQGQWLAHGWQFASRVQFEELATEYISPPGENCVQLCGGGGFSLGYYSSAAAVISALGVTPYTGAGEVSQGFLTGSSLVGYVGAGTQNAYIPDGEWGERALGGSFASAAATGDFLVRSGDYVAAPEPSTWLMVLLGFCGLGYAARQRKYEI